MTLSNTTELKAALVEDIARGDVTAASAVLDRFILQAERYMNNKLRIHEMTKETTLTVDSEYENLPTDFIEVKNIEFQARPALVEPVAERLMSTTGQSTTSGSARSYTLTYDDTNGLYQMRFGPVPDGTRVADLRYYANLPTLTTNSTNNVFAKYPDLYMNGCLYFAFRKYRNIALRDDYFQLFNSDIVSLNGEKSSKEIPTGARVRAIRRI